MTTPQLLLCEGLPGSGKTTTLQQLLLHLESLGCEARWWFEHETDHPVIPYAQAREARQNGPDAARRIFARSHEGWAALAGSLRGVTMLESTLFQTILGSQMLADLPRDEIIAHFDRTVELIAPAEPILIYLRQDDAAAALHRICERRGRWFVEYLQAEFGSSASGRRTGCNDLDAIIDYFRQRCDLSDELFARFAGRKLIHDNTDADWERQRRAFTDLLGLPPIKLPAPPDRPEQYTGRFRAESGDEWTITASGGNLTIAGDNPSRLVPHGLDRFVIEGLCVELVYERRPADGAIEAFGCFGNLPSLPPRWVKV